MPAGLPLSRLINVTLSLSSPLSGFANLASTLLLGVSDVIPANQRVMAFGSPDEVLRLFGPTSGEYRASVAYFNQNPQPAEVFIGRWINVDYAGVLRGIPLTPAQQAIGNFSGITDGSFTINVDGAGLLPVTGVNFTGIVDLNGVASTLQAKMITDGLGVTVAWNGVRFIITSTTVGVGSSVGAMGPTTPAPGIGTYIGPLLGLNVGSFPNTVPGADSEPLLDALAALDNSTTYFYAINTDAVGAMGVPSKLQVATWVESNPIPHIYCTTSADPNALDPANSTDLGSQLQLLEYQRTFVQWSSHSGVAACSLIALFMTIDLSGDNTMITAAYKQEPGIIPESLTVDQANALDQKGFNYYATFNNGVPVIVNGCMACTSILPGHEALNEVYIDEMFGADGLANAIQVNFFNLLAGLPKLPQTDAGAHLGANAIESACVQYVTNGYIAAGTWNAGGFGQLKTGDFLPKGYYVYTPPLATQPQPARAARASVPYQVAAKTAGAVHTADIAITVNP